MCVHVSVEVVAGVHASMHARSIVAHCVSGHDVSAIHAAKSYVAHGRWHAGTVGMAPQKVYTDS